MATRELHISALTSGPLKGFGGVFSHGQKDSDLEHVIIEATVVRAHACSVGLEKNSGSREAQAGAKVA